MNTTYYKASFNGKCLNLQYEEGKIYEIQGKLKICENGFHFCENIESTINYYPYNKNFTLMEVEPLGKIIQEDDKFATDKIKILKIYSHKESHELIKTVGYEYDEKDRLIHFKNNEGYEYWGEYDKNNNLIHFKDSNGDEYWQEFDKNGNLIHYKNNKSFEEWREYDENNNLIHYKNNKSFEEWREYDKNDNCVHHKNSEGYEEWYEYNDKDVLIDYRTKS